MKRLSRITAAVLAAAVALPAVAGAQITQLELVNFGVPPVTFYPTVPGSGPAIGPYNLQGLNPIIAPFTAFCIDYANSVHEGQVWNARILTFDDALSAGNIAAVRRALGTDPAWGQTTLNQSAWLASQFSLNSVSSWDEIQSEIWHLFSPTHLTPTDPGAGAAFLAASAANASGDFSNWRLIVDNNAWDERFQGEYVQTFISTVPEPSTYALMGMGLFAIAFVVRRRSKGTLTA